MTTPAASKTLFLVDGTSQLFRAYFALPGLTSPEGLPTNAVFGFTTMMRKLIREEGAGYLAVAFDVKGKTFRNERYEDYKANRPPTPEDLNVQTPYAKQVCEILGATVLERQGYEADDLIATYARRGRESGFEVVIVASDKDLLQLVDGTVRVFNPSKNLYLDAEAVATGFVVPPARVLDAQGLMGDSVDNIPGVPGVGQKTAIGIVSTYGDLDAVIERAHRFAAFVESRDALVESIAVLGKTAELDEAIAGRVADRGGESRDAAKRLLEREEDPEFRQRLAALRELLDGVDWDAVRGAVGSSGKTAVKPLRPLVKELKAMDRGSSKRAWLNIHEHAEQAQLSKELATLCDDAPVEGSAEDFELRPMDREKARALFTSLGFKALSAELDEPDAADADATRGPGADEATQAGVAAFEVRTILDVAGLERVIVACRESGRLAIETYTIGTDAMQARLVGVGLSWKPGSAAYIPVGHDVIGAPEQLSLAEVRNALGPLLADPDLPKSAHDLKREAHVLRRHELPVAGWDFDTTVAAFLLNSSRGGFSTAELAAEFLSVSIVRYEDIAGSGAKQLPANEVEVERLAGHAGQSAEATLRLADDLRPRLEAAELSELYRTIDGPLLPLLVDMEARGIRVDAELLERMSSEMETALNATRQEIHRLAGTEFNVDSPKQLREVLFDKMGLRPGKKTAKSKVASTDARTLEELAEEHPIARKLLEHREITKLKGTYVDALPRLIHPDTGRVHTSFHPTGAATGRLSSSDPNLQNIPVRTEAGRKIRGAFVPDDGCVFLASDYSQVELRVLAHLCEDEELTAAFQAGEDIHRYTASRVFGVMSDLVTDTMRRRAKAVNFGILYGMSEIRLAREQGMKRTEARDFIQAYFERFASVRGYIDGVREQALRDAAVRTLFGRVRYFPQLHQRLNRNLQEQAYRAAVNTTIQGTAADLMKLAMLAVDAAIRKAKLGARILLQVHDELLLEVPRSELAAVRKLVRGAMEGVHSLRVPLVVDQKSGPSWLDVA